MPLVHPAPLIYASLYPTSKACVSLFHLYEKDLKVINEYKIDDLIELVYLCYLYD